MVAEVLQTTCGVSGTTFRCLAVCAAVNLVALPLAFCEFSAEGTGGFGFFSANIYCFEYGWPWPCVELRETQDLFTSSPPVQAFTWHIGVLLADIATSAGVLIGTGWVANRLFAKRRPQLSLGGLFLVVGLNCAFLVGDETWLWEPEVASQAAVRDIAEYALLRVPLLCGLACLSTAAVVTLWGFAGRCFRRAQAGM